MILADEFAVIFHDRYPGIVLLMPVGARIDVTDFELEPPPYQGQECLDQLLAEVTSLAAVDS